MNERPDHRLRLSSDAEGSPRPGADAEPATPILRRLVIAFVLCVVLAIGCWVLAPRVGVALPPLVPLAGFGVIAAGTLIGVWESRPVLDDRSTLDDDLNDPRV